MQRLRVVATAWVTVPDDEFERYGGASTLDDVVNYLRGQMSELPHEEVDLQHDPDEIEILSIDVVEDDDLRVSDEVIAVGNKLVDLYGELDVWDDDVALRRDAVALVNVARAATPCRTVAANDDDDERRSEMSAS